MTTAPFWISIAALVLSVLSLILQFRKHKQESANLKAEAKIKRGGYKAEITVWSIGKRPITLDKIKYYFSSQNFFEKIYYLFFKDKRSCHTEILEPKNQIELTDGKNGILDVFIPFELDDRKIKRLVIVDQTNHHWEIPIIENR